MDRSLTFQLILKNRPNFPKDLQFFVTRAPSSDFQVTYLLRKLKNFRNNGSPSVPHPPQFNTSLQHKRAGPFQPPKSLRSTPNTPLFNTHLSSIAKICQFHTKNPSVQHTPQFHTENPSVQHQKLLNRVELRGFWCGTEGCVELRDFWCGTDRFLL